MFKIGFFPTNQRKPWGKGSDYCAELCLFLALDSPHENRARKKKHSNHFGKLPYAPTAAESN